MTIEEYIKNQSKSRYQVPERFEKQKNEHIGIQYISHYFLENGKSFPKINIEEYMDNYVELKLAIECFEAMRAWVYRYEAQYGGRLKLN